MRAKPCPGRCLARDNRRASQARLFDFDLELAIPRGLANQVFSFEQRHAAFATGTSASSTTIARSTTIALPRRAGGTIRLAIVRFTGVLPAKPHRNHVIASKRPAVRSGKRTGMLTEDRTGALFKSGQWSRGGGPGSRIGDGRE